MKLVDSSYDLRKSRNEIRRNVTRITEQVRIN